MSSTWSGHGKVTEENYHEPGIAPCIQHCNLYLQILATFLKIHFSLGGFIHILTVVNVGMFSKTEGEEGNERGRKGGRERM